MNPTEQELMNITHEINILENNKNNDNTQQLEQLKKKRRDILYNVFTTQEQIFI